MSDLFFLSSSSREKNGGSTRCFPKPRQLFWHVTAGHMGFSRGFLVVLSSARCFVFDRIGVGLDAGFSNKTMMHSGTSLIVCDEAVI